MRPGSGDRAAIIGEVELVGAEAVVVAADEAGRAAAVAVTVALVLPAPVVRPAQVVIICSLKSIVFYSSTTPTPSNIIYSLRA